LLFLLKIKYTRAPIVVRAPTPPTTPPAIAPVFECANLEDGLGVLGATFEEDADVSGVERVGEEDGADRVEVELAEPFPNIDFKATSPQVGGNRLPLW